MNPVSPRRITMILKNPNPVFEKWLKEYMDEAEEQGSMQQYNALNYALINLRKYKLPLKSARECRILKGFSEKICAMLNSKQEAYSSNQNIECTTAISDNDNKVKVTQSVSSSRQEDSVICLDSDSDDENIRKLVQKTVDSFGRNIIENQYTSEDILLKIPSCSSSSQTSSGTSNNKRRNLKRHASSSASSSKPKTLKKFSSVSSITSSKNSIEVVDDFIMVPGNFDVILYVDTGEVAGGNTKIKDDPILSELQKLGTRYEVKDLKVGDYVWICRDRILQRELVLPHIIERKRIDDFAKSIKDGRYYEQKYRLKRSGIQYITYLIEQSKISRVGLPKASLDQATDNTAIRDGLYVKVTKDIKHTARYLNDMTDLLHEEYRSKTLASCRKENLVTISDGDDLVSLMVFKEFNQSSIKNKPSKISERFVRMLLQINKMTVDKALGLVQEYPTPFLLQKAYKNEDVDREKLLASIQGKFSSQALGLPLSKIVSDFFK